MHSYDRGIPGIIANRTDSSNSTTALGVAIEFVSDQHQSLIDSNDTNAITMQNNTILSRDQVTVYQQDICCD